MILNWYVHLLHYESARPLVLACNASPNGLGVVLSLEVYRYIGSAKYRLLIWQNLQYQKLVFFETAQIYLIIFLYTPII